jgi:hypothetical protein
MKKLIFFFFLLASMRLIGQQSITNKLYTSVRSGGAGVAYFTINYKTGKYTTQETDLITINAADTNNITYNVHLVIMDTGKARIDTNMVLNTSQIGLLNSFYQASCNKTNPDPTVSTSKKGANAKLVVSLCCADATDITYTSSFHISLCRYLLTYWTNWN